MKEITKSAEVEVAVESLSETRSTHFASADLKQQGIVIVARRDGRIVRRGLGAPAWEIIIDDIKDAKKS